jgi:hypothetical protein
MRKGFLSVSEQEEGDDMIYLFFGRWIDNEIYLFW